DGEELAGEVDDAGAGGDADVGGEDVGDEAAVETIGAADQANPAVRVGHGPGATVSGGHRHKSGGRIVRMLAGHRPEAEGADEPGLIHGVGLASHDELRGT